ncbi:MAG: iron-containing alcohol dehydrogenase family protein [Erysipelotrichaceae bacterium]|nr:iron-containing alcohol dehydrogenase family protein [Erysipelotrichaceae bacterium]
MKIYMPVRVYDEAECVKAHAKELASYGSKALIVTGRHSAVACGAQKDVTDALEEYGKSWCIFNEIEENPSVETVLKAAEFGKKEEADFVIGIGGGSPLDAAKAIAFCMKQNATAEDLYDASLPADALDVIAVPTTCGTGSEVTGVSVLTVHAKSTKISIPHRIFPKLALIDGKYLKNAPHSMIVNTAVDAFAHMAESYLSKKADDFSMAAALRGLSIFSEVKDVLIGEREANDEDRAKLMRAAAFGGIAIVTTGTSVPHALSYILTYDEKIPHGKAAGYFLERFISFAKDEDQKAILNAAGFASMADFGTFMSKAFGEIEVKEETLQRAYETVGSNTVRMKSSRVELDKDKLKAIVNLK